MINLCKNGDHYWVFAHVTPSFDEIGNIIGYHSSRRVPERQAINQIEPIYKMLREKEDSYADWREGMNKAMSILIEHLEQQGLRYDQFVFAL
ncbi:MAG: hypothetical protein JKY95_19725 [Planctomycetaceae bacterium]|nr:hypothetical protein [Planctomycetaceae bacterium]